MKHLGRIQAEFLKEAAKWDELSRETQEQYLKEHPKSKRRLTAHNPIDDRIKEQQKLPLWKKGDGDFAEYRRSKERPSGGEWNRVKKREKRSKRELTRLVEKERSEMAKSKLDEKKEQTKPTESVEAIIKDYSHLKLANGIMKALPQFKKGSKMGYGNAKVTHLYSKGTGNKDKLFTYLKNLGFEVKEGDTGYTLTSDKFNGNIIIPKPETTTTPDILHVTIHERSKQKPSQGLLYD